MINKIENKIHTTFMLADIEGEESENVIELVAEADDDSIDEQIPEHLPLLPIKNTVLFPGVVIPITVSRAKSIKLVKEVYKEGKVIGVITQKIKKYQTLKKRIFIQ